MGKTLLLVSFFCITLSSSLFSQSSISITNSETKSTSVENGTEKTTAEEAAKKALNVGAKIPSFILPNAKNELVSSEDLLEEGNLVLVFYRGAWCPYCNTYLKKLQNNLEQIEANGGKLVAVSVENPDTSMVVSKKNEVAFTVLSDKKLELARKFGIVFQLSAETNEKYKGFGIDLVKQNETETPDLPLSATYVVNQSGEIIYAFLDPDYKKRAEPNDIVEVLTKIKGQKKSVKAKNEL